MSGIDWLVVIGVVVIITCIVYLVTRARNAKSTKLKTQPPMRTVSEKLRSEKKRLSMLDKPYTEQRATRILRQGHRMRRTVTMEYDTANPMPGQPAINIRDVDVYGLGNGYVDTFCHLRNEKRTFKISRIRWVRLGIGTYQMPTGYVPSTWVKYGWGEVSDKGLEDAEPITEEVSSTSASSAPPDKWVWQDTTSQAPSTAELDKLHKQRKAVLPSERGEGPPKSYVHTDWQKHFEDSIKSPFPEELSPASRFLYEAYQLEKEGANQAKIDQVLRKAWKADPKATEFYISRQSIIKKRKRK